MLGHLLIFSVGLLSLTVILNRYYWGKVLPLLKRKIRKTNLTTELPTVEVIIPCFNEGQGIYHTINSILQSDYPSDLLKITVVDDCSTDESYEWALKAQLIAPTQVNIIRNQSNVGKRKGINKAVHLSQAKIIISVDSDVVIDPQAIRILASSFESEKVAAVGGKVKVQNKNQSWLTKMQTVKYYFGYEFLKGLENSQRQVMCLSGCLTAYQRRVLLELEPILENRSVLGIPIKYGEDRFLTRQIVKAGYETILNLDAFCSTVAPPTLAGYFKQQLRWRRSNFIDVMGGITHLSRLKPLVMVHYLSVATLQLLYPLVVLLHMFNGDFLFMLMLHLGVLLSLSLFYLFDFSYSSWREKVNPLWFLAMGPLMPITYLFLSPLALFTLDSGSWETRKKQGQNTLLQKAQDLLSMQLDQSQWCRKFIQFIKLKGKSTRL